MTDTAEASTAASLLDEAIRLTHRGGSVCRVALMRESHPGLAAELDAAFGKVTTTALVRALKGRGVELSDQTVNRHYRRECACHEPR